MPDFHYYLHQIKVLPLQEVFRRGFLIISQKISDKVNKIGDHLFDTEISDSAFLKSSWNQNYRFQNAQEMRRHFLEREKPAFYVDALHRDKIVPVMTRHFQGEKDRAIAQADKVCNHIFDLLGSGDVNLGDKIDWHCDFKTGYCWSPKKYYRDIQIPYGEGDIKVPWELSRFSHAVSLGQAYWLTKDEKYAREFAAQVSDWIDSNKPKFGVNWNCTMDVAIRACNWIAGYGFFRDSPEITDEFLLKFLKSLYQHGRHIRSNLEYSEVLTSNHYLSNISGLVYLGVMFPEFREAEEWKEFGIQELIKEMVKQVYADGCDFEASTCYHCLVLELFFFPTLLVVVNDPLFDGGNHREVAEKVFGKGFVDQLHRMFETVLYLIKPNGMMPQIGDNDSGRLHFFAGRKVLDMRYLLALGAVFFHESKFRVKEFGFSGEALWVFGETGYGLWQRLEENAFENLMSRSFPDAGWHVMRNEWDYLIISCGPNGPGNHAHNDKLSFELCLDGTDIFVDPGSYVYTQEPEMRNLFRSTGYHNTVTANNLEQNSLDTGLYLFNLKDDSMAKSNMWKSERLHDAFSGEHFGFDKYGYRHQRSFHFIKPEGAVRIIDSVTGKSPQSIACFHLLPGAGVAERGEGIFSVRNALITFKGHARVEIADSWYSPEYGRKEKCICIRVFFSDSLETFISREKLS